MPLRWYRRLSAAKAVLPAETLLFDGSAFRFGANQGRVARTVGLAKSMSTGDEGDGFLIIHRHAGKGLTNIMSGSCWDRFSVRSFRVDIDQTHLHGSQGIFKIPFTE